MSKEGDSFKVNFLILKSFYDRNYINLIFNIFNKMRKNYNFIGFLLIFQFPTYVLLQY